MTDYLKTSTAKQRLAKARLMALNANTNYKTEHFTWKYFRVKFTKGYTGGCHGFNTHYGKKVPVYTAFNEADLPIKGYQFADDVNKSIEHRGHYCGDDGDNGKARGIVCRIDGRKWLAAYYWSDNGEFVIRTDEVHTDIEDAASSADDFAEDFAEMAWEDNAKFNTARDIESKIDDAIHRLRECLVMRNRACMAYVRDEAIELIEKIKDMRQTLQTEYADYV